MIRINITNSSKFLLTMLFKGKEYSDSPLLRMTIPLVQLISDNLMSLSYQSTLAPNHQIMLLKSLSPQKK